MLFHRCQDTKIALNALRVVIANIAMNHLRDIVFTGEPLAVIAFPLQDAPEALHRAVINAMCHTGHTLCHSSMNKLLVKHPIGVLKASVTVEQGMCIRIGLHRLVKGFENQWIIVVLTEYISPWYF